ncbi:MAG: condensation domain-containing protein, partial [bacterium]
LIQFHDALRLRYQPVPSSPELSQQHYHTDIADNILKVLDVRTIPAPLGSQDFEEKLQAILTAYQSSFNIYNGPLYSIAYLHGYEDGSSRIFFAFHHLIIDAVSWRILRDDLQQIYLSLTTDSSHTASKGTSYRQWAAAIQSYPQKNPAESTYWNNVIAGIDKANGTFNTIFQPTTTTASASVVLDKNTTKKLLTDSPAAYHTEINDLLLTAFAIAYNKITAGDTCYITLEGHGREEIDPSIDINNTVGWFTTMFPLRLTTTHKGIGENIKHIKEELRAIPNKGMGYGPIIGYDLQALPQITFNYLGQFDLDENNNQQWTITNEASGLTTAVQNKA